MTKFKIAKEYRSYIYFGIMLCAVILFYKFVGNLKLFFSFFTSTVNFIIHSLKPLFWSFLITYFLYRPVDYLDRKILRLHFFKRHVKMSRILSIVIIYIISIAFVYWIFSFIIPQIWESLTVLFYNVPVYIDEIKRYLNEFHVDKGVSEFLTNLNIGKTASNSGIQGAVLELLSKSDITFDNAFSFLLQRFMSVSAFIINLVISMFLALYLLLDKEIIGRQFSRTVEFIISKSAYKKFINISKLIDQVFFKFLIGKIYCSIFVSVIVFLGLLMIKVQHASLISFIIAVTNIIPYFGPIIGGSIGVLITLLYSPVQALWVLILVVVSQQLDDNILGPKVLGERIGLKPFWIMLSVVVGGELFGVRGMFLAVPVFAVIRILFVQWFQMYRGKNGC